MKIHRLSVRNVRGLPEIDLDFQGENVVIWGPNGSGKSGVVDALDFLFTGQIARLRGEGTGLLTLAKHGHHVLHDAKDASVHASVDFENGMGAVEISREFAPPRDLIYPSEVQDALGPALRIAERGQMCLTRRDVLKFIAAEGRPRAEQIQELLNLSEVESTRRAIVTAKNKLETQKTNAGIRVAEHEAQIVELLPSEHFDREELRTEVNIRRERLGGRPTDEILSGSLQTDLSRPVEKATPTFSAAVFSKAIDGIEQFITGSEYESANETEKELRELLEQLASDESLKVALRQYELIQRGLAMIDDTTEACPLCDAEWRPGELVKHLRQKHSVASRAAKIREVLLEKSGKLGQQLAGIVGHLSSVDSEIGHASTGVFTDEQRKAISAWAQAVRDITTAVGDPENRYLQSVERSSQFRVLISPKGVQDRLASLKTAANSVQLQSTPEQDARDWLIRLGERLGNFEVAQARQHLASVLANRGRVLETVYEHSRDDILEALYDRVGSRFRSFYRRLHPHGPEPFDVSIEPDGPALNLNVLFDDGEMYPPNAVHSEGHQDSMGLCLFLALHEELTPEASSLVVLDDVVMSLDTGHRRYICTLLNEEFGKRQFVITTHDRAWANQLRRTNVVGPRNSVEFTSWNLHTGPQVHTRLRLWEEIEQALEREETHTAASKLRRSSEEFYESVCDALDVRIRYNSMHQWDLGDYLLPALDRYRELIKRAKQVAEAWNQKEQAATVTEVDLARSEAYKSLNEDWWTVNSTVHFDKWVDLEANELRPIVETFKKLEGFFECERCHELVVLVTDNGRPLSLKCRCNAVSFNMEQR